MLDRLRAGLAATDDAGGSAALRAADRGRDFAALPLTPRKPVVMHGLGAGKTDRDSATLLGCSHRMVQKHLQRMDASSRARVETRTAAVMRVLGAAHHCFSRVEQTLRSELRRNALLKTWLAVLVTLKLPKFWRRPRAARVSPACHVLGSSRPSVRGAQYSAPSQLVGQRLTVRLYTDPIECWLGGVRVLERARLRDGQRHLRDIGHPNQSFSSGLAPQGV